MCFALLPLLTLLPKAAAPLTNPLQAMPLTYYFLLYHDLLLLILSCLILFMLYGHQAIFLFSFPVLCNANVRQLM